MRFMQNGPECPKAVLESNSAVTISFKLLSNTFVLTDAEVIQPRI